MTTWGPTNGPTFEPNPFLIPQQKSRIFDEKKQPTDQPQYLNEWSPRWFAIDHG